MTKQQSKGRNAAAKTSKTTKTTKGAKTTKAVKETKKPSLRNLWQRQMHSILAFAYAIEAGLILFLSSSKTVGVTGSYLAKDDLKSNIDGAAVYASASHHLLDINLAQLTAGFLIVAAIAHIVIAIIIKRDKWPAATKAEHERRVRWLGIGVSGSLVAITLGLVVGLQDIATLACLIGLTALVAIAGYVLESRQLLSKKIIYSFAGISAVVPWLILGASIVMAAQYGSLTAVVQWIYVVAFLLALLLYVGVYNLYAGRRPLRLEANVFISLVVFAMYSSLAWQVYAGLLRV